MKKTYKIPVLETIKIETHKMLAESLQQLENPVTDPLGREDEGYEW